MTVVPVLVSALLLLFHQDPASKPKTQDGGAHDAHAKINERGEHAMGFSRATTTHHFLLRLDGGMIQVEVKDPNDAGSRDNIRMHLGHIAKMFARGDFNIPMFVHDTVPPGVPEMKQLQKQIHYTFQETPNEDASSSGQPIKRPSTPFTDSFASRFKNTKPGTPNCSIREPAR